MVCCLFCQRLEIARTTGNREAECATLCNLGNCFRSSGKLKESLEYYLLVSCVSTNYHNISAELWSLGTHNPISVLQQSLHSQNLELSRATGNVSGEIVSLLNLGITCEILDKLDKAIEWHTLVRLTSSQPLQPLWHVALW